MTVLALVLSLLALLVAGYSAWNGRRAANAATKSAEVAADSRDAAQRSAKASEQQAALAKAAADQYEVPWTLVAAGGDMVRLTNTNRVETCFDVVVDAADLSGTPHMAPLHTEIGPGASVDFFGIRGTYDTPDTRIRVRWRRTPDGEQLGPWLHSSDL